MKTQLIMLDTPIIVSDEKPIEGDLIFNKFGLLHNEQVISKCSKNAETNWANNMMINNNTKSIREGIFKIIAGIEGLPEIDWNRLEEEFGWIDIEEIIAQELGFNEYESDIRVKILNLSKRLKKAQSLNEKKFSLDSVEQAIQLARDHRFDTAHGVEWDYSEDEIIHALQQSKVFDIEVDAFLEGGFHTIPTIKPKITNNSIKILKKL